METTDSTTGAAVDRVHQLANENQVPVIIETFASKDFKATTAKDLDIDSNGNPSADSGANSISNHTTNELHASTARNGIAESTTNDHSVAGSIDNDAQQANPQSFVPSEEKTTDTPDIQIDGEAETEHVNKDIMGPEDEEDGELPALQISGNTNFAQKKKSKKKPKSKRGLVIAPRCRYRITTLIVEPRMHPLDSRNFMLTLR